MKATVDSQIEELNSKISELEERISQQPLGVDAETVDEAITSLREENSTSLEELRAQTSNMIEQLK